MEIKFNLLPQERKRKIQRNNILRFVVWQEVVIIFIIVFFFGIVQSINFIIELQANEAKQVIITQKESRKYQEIEKYEKYLQALNKKVVLIDRAQLNNADWYEVFREMSSLIPDGVVVKELAVDRTDIVIRGVAKSRDSLIEMKKVFDNSECFASVEIPLNDIVLKRDIDFELNLRVKRKCLFEYEK